MQMRSEQTQPVANDSNHVHSERILSIGQDILMDNMQLSNKGTW